MIYLTNIATASRSLLPRRQSVHEGVALQVRPADFFRTQSLPPIGLKLNPNLLNKKIIRVSKEKDIETVIRPNYCMAY